MPGRIFLLRHAETAAPDVFHGAESDVELSERGRRQADIVAGVLAGHRPVAILSSAMRRARETAAAIAAACGLSVQIEPDLHERRVGSLSGQPFHGEDSAWPKTLARWVAHETNYAPPGAESFDDIQARVLPVWKRLAEQYSGQTIVIVAHGIVCKVLLLSLLPGWSVADWNRLGPAQNVGIHELVQENGSWHCVRLNQVPEAARA